MGSIGPCYGQVVDVRSRDGMCPSSTAFLSALLLGLNPRYGSDPCYSEVVYGGFVNVGHDFVDICLIPE